MEALRIIQHELKAPKGQFNSYGGYKYRSCEDILEAVKPLLYKNSCSLTITDEIVEVGGRIYVKATATLDSNDGHVASTTAYAREEETKKGMDASQITGSASSYARKYALNGLFAIDDTKDADATNMHGKEPAPAPKAKVDDSLRKLISECTSSGAVAALWKANKELQANAEFKNLITKKGKELKAKEGGSDEAA